MAGMAQKSKAAITIKGSVDIVCDYLNYGINSILFQRGLYPPEDFERVESYGLTILMSTNDAIKKFLSSTFSQLQEWLMKKSVSRVSLVVANVRTLEVMERWDFNVEYEGKADENGEQISNKPLKQIQHEIRDVLKQIASSVAYLPLLDCLCSFDILIYTGSDVKCPDEWKEAEAAHVKNAQSVKMRSFSTDIHKMETIVTYKNQD